MKHLIFLIALFALIGCAAKVGEDKSEDLKNENTNLKVQIVQLQIDKKQALERQESALKALDACFSKRAP